MRGTHGDLTRRRRRRPRPTEREAGGGRRDFELGTGFSWNGMLMASEETFDRFLMRPARRRSTSGSFNSRPGRTRPRCQHELRAVLPAGRAGCSPAPRSTQQERRYWLRLTSVGQFLVVAVVLAVVVGVIFVYQMMAADIRNMLPEYATVKALGYRPPYLTAVVLWQAVLLALLGYVPGVRRRARAVLRRPGTAAASRPG